MNTARLLKLASFLQKLKPEKFDIDRVVEEWDEKKHCGTVCCAAGWTPAVFPRLVEWYGDVQHSIRFKGPDKSSTPQWPEVIAKLFDIPLETDNLIDKIFTGWGYDRVRPATPKHVAAKIREVVHAYKAANRKHRPRTRKNPAKRKGVLRGSARKTRRAGLGTRVGTKRT